MSVPKTGHPLPLEQNGALEWALTRDLERIRPTIYAPMTLEVSFEASAVLDSGERFDAFLLGGAIYRCGFRSTLL